MIITSSSNEKIKAIRRLRERKERQTSQLCYVEGLRLVIEAITLKAEVKSLVVAPELFTSQSGQQIVKAARDNQIEVIETSAAVFRSLAMKDDPQGIAAVVGQRWTPLGEVKIQNGDTWVALVEVADPGNLGTILRTLDAVAGKGVILLDHSTDPYDPTAIRASMGALFSLEIVKASLQDFETWKKQVSLVVVGAADDGAEDYHRFAYPDKMVLMMGSERQGFLPRHAQLCDQIVRIPMVGRSDSLNLAVATSVILYEMYNKNRDEGNGS